MTYLAVPVKLKLRTSSDLYFEARFQVSFKAGEDVNDQAIDRFSKSLVLAISLLDGFGVGSRYMTGISKVGNFDSHQIIVILKKSYSVELILRYTVYQIMPSGLCICDYSSNLFSDIILIAYGFIDLCIIRIH